MGTALAMYIAFLLLTTWIPKRWKLRAVGYGLSMDILVHVILQTMFGGDANGRAGLLLAGVLINLTMHGYRYWHGHSKLTIRGWKTFPPKRTHPNGQA